MISYSTSRVLPASPTGLLCYKPLWYYLKVLMKQNGVLIASAYYFISCRNSHSEREKDTDLCLHRHKAARMAQLLTRPEDEGKHICEQCGRIWHLNRFMVKKTKNCLDTTHAVMQYNYTITTYQYNVVIQPCSYFLCKQPLN